LLFRKSVKVLVTGQAGALFLREMNCPSEKIVVFPYWVPLPPTPVLDRGYPEQHSDTRPVRFIAIGRLEPIKRFDVAIAAIANVLKEIGTDAAKLVIVGDGSERQRLYDLVKGAGIEKCVEFAGWLEHAATMDLLEKSDVLVHSADWEPYGVVILEAMARGKPVIASDMSMAAVDRITHGLCGFMFRTGDAVELAKLMREFIVERTLIAQMGAAARKVAEAWPVDRGVSILKEILGHR
jgi:glycosyltransferase involved in cell wall biosynthesis